MDAYRAIESAASTAANRFDLWSSIANQLGVTACAEIGVFKGEYAEHVLKNCAAVERYFMVDPWKHLEDWNKPANRPDDEFCEIKEEALSRTEFA